MITYHPQASTTYKTRKAIKENIDNLSMKQQADKYNIALHTVSRWRNREDFYDKKHGAINPSKSISDLEEYIICEIRKTTLLPLDDLLDIVKGLGIKITRSSLARALQRNDLSNLSKYIKSLNEEDKPKHSKFKEYKRANSS
jgi:transposase